MTTRTRSLINDNFIRTITLCTHSLACSIQWGTPLFVIIACWNGILFRLSCGCNFHLFLIVFPVIFGNRRYLIFLRLESRERAINAIWSHYCSNRTTSCQLFSLSLCIFILLDKPFLSYWEECFMFRNQGSDTVGKLIMFFLLYLLKKDRVASEIVDIFVAITAFTLPNMLLKALL